MSDLDARSKHLRRLIVRGLVGAKGGHIGPSMSLVEILSVLYDDVMRHRPEEPEWPDRDRLILSKGHGALALYAILADKGYFPAEELDRFCHRDGLLGGHPDMKIPGVEAATGSLGLGLAMGVGMALAARIQKRPSRVFVVMGDGECQEGSVWEAAMAAARHRLTNLIVIVDYNGLQSAMGTEWVKMFVKKWMTFGFCATAIDGHDIPELRKMLEVESEHLPMAFICNTVKGKGIPFAEGDPTWHHRANLDEATLARLQEVIT